jgi:spoIIIJ-associated protein
MKVEVTGRTVEEAVARALEELGVERDDVEVEVLDPGARGMLGLGARDARVRVTVRPSPAGVAHQLMARLLDYLGIPGTVRAREQDGEVQVVVEGDQLGALIGHRGATLDAVQLLLGLMVSRRVRSPVRVAVDAGGYRQRRVAALQEQARRAAERAVREGREVALAPMSPADRRVIHTTLAGHPAVVTQSRGEGDARRVVVIPRPSGDAASSSGH